MDVQRDASAEVPASTVPQEQCLGSGTASCFFASPSKSQFERVTASLHAGPASRPLGAPAGFYPNNKASSPNATALSTSGFESSSEQGSPDAVVDITCFLRTRVATKGPVTPKVKEMECLLMSPTRRIARKPNSWHWNYTMPNAAPEAKTFGPSKATPLGSPVGLSAADAAAHAVGNLQMGTPVALAAGLLGDASDRT